jgi:hypothetical protein
MKNNHNAFLFILVFLFGIISKANSQDTSSIRKDSVSSYSTLNQKADTTITDTLQQPISIPDTVHNPVPIKKPTHVTDSSSDLYTNKFSDSLKNSFSINNGYYIQYPRQFILRIYLRSKFAPFTISSNGKEDLNYKTNSKLGLGLGFTYKALTLNVAYGFNFLNPENGKGKTKGIDLQLHLYPKKWAIDATGAFLNGYYLDPKDYNGLNLSDYYLRPDLQRNVIGVSAYHLTNSDKFSYKAAFTQRDWQIRSAGSFLYGAEIHYGVVRGDSALVPSGASPDYVQAGIDKIQFLGIGPGIGYAYTFVMGKYFFITASAIASLNVNISAESSGIIKNTVTKILPAGNYKGAIGYNSDSWCISASLMGNALYAGSAISDKEYFLPTGNVSFMVAKKFGTKRQN